MKWQALVLLGLVTAVACAGPRPILYPNDHLKAVGQAAADQDIGECRAMAEGAGTAPGEKSGTEAVGSTVVGAGVGAATGAVGGAVVGAAGRGSAIGAASGATAGFLRWLLAPSKPTEAHMRFVNRCLEERGYEPVGWE